MAEGGAPATTAQALHDWLKLESVFNPDTDERRAAIELVDDQAFLAERYVLEDDGSIREAIVGRLTDRCVLLELLLVMKYHQQHTVLFVARLEGRGRRVVARKARDWRVRCTAVRALS